MAQTKTLLRDSSTVEQSPVKRLVAGSNPAPGAVFLTGKNRAADCSPEQTKLFDEKVLVEGEIPTSGALKIFLICNDYFWYPFRVQNFCDNIKK